MQQSKISDGTLRIISGLMIGLVCIACSLASGKIQVGFLIVILCFCAYEIFRFLSIAHQPLRIYAAVIVVLGGIIGYALYSDYLLWFTLAGCVVMIARLVRIPSDQFNPFPTLFQVGIYPGLCLGLLARFLLDGDFVIPLLLFYFIVIWASDVGAYYCGRKFGKRKLAKHISPNKTIEGFLGGGLAAILVSSIWFISFNQKSLLFYLLLGLTIWIFCSMGDLVQSKIKRQFKIKDSSNIIPGHGGVFDRFDGFIFAAPFFVLAYSILY